MIIANKGDPLPELAMTIHSQKVLKKRFRTINNYTRTVNRYPFLYPTSTHYDVKITNNHWQLRNLTKFKSQDKEKVLYLEKKDVRCLDLQSGTSEVICSTDFFPKTFEEVDDVVISGGLIDSDQTPGKVWVHSSSTGKSLTETVGRVIANSVSIDKVLQSQYRSYVCSNDMCLYNLDISNGGIKVKSGLNIGYPLNYSKLSNNKKTLVVSGDETTLTMVDPTSNQIIKKVPVNLPSVDYGFSIDFHNGDLYFAVAFQSGKALLYDVRHVDEPVHTFQSVGKNEVAFRHLKFSSNYSTDDYLFIAEHMGKVHVVDIRNFENHKIVTLPSQYGSGKGEAAECLIIEDLNEYLEDEQSKSYVWPYLRSGNPCKAVKLLTAQPYYIADQKPYEVSDYDIFGMDWAFDRNGSSLIIGGAAGITKWTMDSWSRRSFGNYEFC